MSNQHPIKQRQAAAIRECPKCRSTVAPRFVAPVDSGIACVYGLEYSCPVCEQHVIETHELGSAEPRPGDCLACNGGELDLGGRCRRCDVLHEQLRASIGRRFGLPSRLGELSEIYERGEHRLALLATGLRLQASPGDREARLIRAKLMIELHQPEAALPLLREILAHGRDPDASIHLGMALANSGSHLRAVEVYERYLAEHPDHGGYAVVLSNIGGCLSALGRVEEAEQYHRRAIATGPEHGGPRWNLMANLLKQGRIDEGLAVLGEAAALSFHPPERRAELHAVHAQILLRFGRFEQALEAIDASLAAAPERLESLLLRAMLLLRLGRHDQARLALLCVLELEPRHPEARGLLAQLNRQRDVWPS